MVLISCADSSMAESRTSNPMIGVQIPVGAVIFTFQTAYTPNQIWRLMIYIKVRKLMKVNDCSITIFKQHVEEAFNIWQERSKKKWKTDSGNYSKQYVQKNYFNNLTFIF